MTRKIKAVALSTFVLPGLGQLYLGHRVKGGVMILLDNVFILAGLFIALRSAGKMLLAGKTGVAPDRVLAAIRADNPLATYVLGAFMVLWVYGVVDALLDKSDSQRR